MFCDIVDTKLKRKEGRLESCSDDKESGDAGVTQRGKQKQARVKNAWELC